MITIGILAVQGAFIEHEQMLASLGVTTRTLRNKEDLLQPIDGLILPGGESTAMRKLLDDLDMMDTLKQLISNGLPVFGTCAGLILLAKTIENDNTIHFGTMDITIVRNGYGRQLGSFKTTEHVVGLGLVPMVFIRAPFIRSVGSSVDILATHDDKIIAVLQSNQLGTTFHPELSGDARFHKLFISIVEKNKNP